MQTITTPQAAVLRSASPWEIPERISYDWAMVPEEDGKPTGYVCILLADGFPWIHELQYWGTDKTMALRMLRAAKEAVKDMGFSAVMVSTYNAKLQAMLLKHGFEVSHTILKGSL